MIDFLIIGAGKSGSTSLYYYIAQHPRIFLSRIKEPRYFLWPHMDQEPSEEQREEFLNKHNGAVIDRNEYLKLFASASPRQLRGEASIAYLSSEIAARNIGKYAPDAKLICVLRNPIDRALSNFSHFVRDGADTRSSLIEVLKQDGINHPYFQGGFYNQHLDYYSRHAPMNSIAIWLYEDLLERPLQTIQDMFTYLGVDATYIPDITVRANVSGNANPQNLWARFYDLLRNSKLRQSTIMRKIIPIGMRRYALKHLAARADLGRVKPDITDHERAILFDVYKSDIEALEQRIGRSLQRWHHPLPSEIR